MRKKINLLLFLSGILILGFTSCQKDGYQETNFVFDIEDEFELSLTEQLTQGENTSLLMNISSLREFDCENYGLQSSKRVFASNTIEVSVSELITPDNCIEGKAPALGQVTFDALEVGAYALNIFIVNQIENKGTLFVHPNHYDIEIEEGNGILLSQKTLNKIPQQTIWGYVSYEDYNIDFVSDLLADLDQSLDSVVLPNGNYGHFELDDGEIVIPDVKVPHTKHLSFIFHLNTSIDELINTVEENFCPQYNSKIGLKIFTTDGIEIECL